MSTMNAMAAIAWAAPFVGLLLTIALAPLVASAFWHRHYGKCAALWALAYVLPEVTRHGALATAEMIAEMALHEYLPFVLMLGALFVIAGGLRIIGAPHGGPGVNTAMLALGTAIASVIGTTGAAMVMIRPMIRANRHRRHISHVFVFFILLVANVGGALSPLGDPPLFLGYLAGVPFFWPLVHLWAPTAIITVGLLGAFYIIEYWFFYRSRDVPAPVASDKLGIEGTINIAMLIAVVAIVLLRGAWRPDWTVTIFHIEWELGDVVTDGLLLAVGLVSWWLTPPAIRKANAFTWAPMVEVAILFAAIFVTIIPVMAMIAAGKEGPAAPLVSLLFDAGAPRDSAFFWLTGLLSAFLDNAPTYLVFFGFAGADAVQLAGPLASTLTAVAAGAVFCGALTYIGNAPNLMVKAIVESQDIAMPSFFAYMAWATLCLGPWLILVDVLFFR